MVDRELRELFRGEAGAGFACSASRNLIESVARWGANAQNSAGVFALEECPSPNNPRGAKGAGEGGVIPVGGVIANAVGAALGSLGVQPRELPLSPPRVWQLINDVREAGKR